jgi:hypothetical protein
MGKAVRRARRNVGREGGAVGGSANAVGTRPWASTHRGPTTGAGWLLALANGWLSGAGLGCADEQVFADGWPTLDARRPIPWSPAPVDPGGAGGSGAGLTSESCSDSAGCGPCQECAVAAEGPCEAEQAECSADENCEALWACVATCQDALCADGCYDTYWAGTTRYSALYLCVLCDVCATKCEVAGSCG